MTLARRLVCCYLFKVHNWRYLPGGVFSLVCRDCGRRTGAGGLL